MRVTKLPSPMPTDERLQTIINMQSDLDGMKRDTIERMASEIDVACLDAWHAIRSHTATLNPTPEDWTDRASVRAWRIKRAIIQRALQVIIQRSI